VSWSELAALGVTVRPFDGSKPQAGDRWSPFSATLSSTIEILSDELRHLDATNVVIELDVRERDIRLDGLPRADARPAHDAVAISFQSKFGPLRYATAEFTTSYRQAGWTQNLRAIALAMRALRAVDRYGVSKRGEQYRGWRAIAAGPPSVEDQIPDVAAARAFLDERYGGSLRDALLASHPDRPGGSDEEFHRVVRCKELLAG
jgi:hypothetical protein